MNLQRRGPGANGGHHTPGPDEAVPGLPGVTHAKAAELAEEANAWYGALADVRPGGVRFRVCNKLVRARGADGEPVEETAVQLWGITANGITVWHMPADLADELAAMLHTGATEARTGLDTRHRKIITAADG